MPEDVIPGSRVRTTTKHGTLTADEIASMLPGMARLMDEMAHRYWVLYYAAKGGNWALAAYMERESAKLLETMALARPKYKKDLAAFAKANLEPIARAIEAEDWPAFDAAYRASIDASDVYHEKYKKGFIRFRLPERAPEWFDLGPQ